MNDFWSVAEQSVRDILFDATSVISDEEAAGLLFGVGLVLTDHLFRIARKVLS